MLLAATDDDLLRVAEAAYGRNVEIFAVRLIDRLAECGLGGLGCGDVENEAERYEHGQTRRARKETRRTNRKHTQTLSR